MGDGGGSPLLMARSCVVRASCANASARSANRLRNNHEVDYCLGGSLRRGGEEDADGLVFAGGGGEGEYEGFAGPILGARAHAYGRRGVGGLDDVVDFLEVALAPFGSAVDGELALEHEWLGVAHDVAHAEEGLVGVLDVDVGGVVDANDLLGARVDVGIEVEDGLV
eukprot:scaffold33651_cov124-Isochrysis_galbana.AAC.1